MFTTMTDLVWEADVHLIHVDPHFWVFYNTTQMMMNMLMMMMNMLMMTMLMVMFLLLRSSSLTSILFVVHPHFWVFYNRWDFIKLEHDDISN